MDGIWWEVIGLGNNAGGVVIRKSLTSSPAKREKIEHINQADKQKQNTVDLIDSEEDLYSSSEDDILGTINFEEVNGSELLHDGDPEFLPCKARFANLTVESSRSGYGIFIHVGLVLECDYVRFLGGYSGAIEEGGFYTSSSCILLRNSEVSAQTDGVSSLAPLIMLRPYPYCRK